MLHTCGSLRTTFLGVKAFSLHHVGPGIELRSLDLAGSKYLYPVKPSCQLCSNILREAE